MKKFLINEFEKEKGNQLYLRQQQKLLELLNENRDKSKYQYKTLKKRILPRIALYQILQELDFDKNYSLNIVNKYFNKEVQKIVNIVHLAEKLPNFYFVFSKVFNTALKKDNWQITIGQNDKKAFSFKINKCLWYDTCVQYDCPEMCKMFCESDYICYGSMKKVIFNRTQTLGTGGNFCDFKFLNSKYL